jgi:uncharacterized protein GlcG (DUF336 family)
MLDVERTLPVARNKDNCQMTSFSLTHANTIVEAALAAGKAHGMMPLTVAVLDAGGHLVALQRQDGSGILRVEIARGKAWASLGMGAPSRLLRDRLSPERQYFITGLVGASDGKFICVPGGVLIYAEKGGPVIGAVGISGDTSDKDEYAAIQGIKAAGLISNPAEPIDNWAGSSL